MTNINYLIFNKITKKLRNNLIKTMSEKICDELFDDVDEKLFKRKNQKIYSDSMCKENLKRKLGMITEDDGRITFTGLGNLII